MTKERQFSHITVSADEDDDIVIQAGIVEAPADEPPVAPPAPSEPVAVEVGEAEEGPAASVSRSAVVAEEPVAPAPARPDDGYRETTLEDIESSKMNSVQKAVIVVALLGIVAFVVWFLVAR
ncbi:SURF2 Surfeit locus protein 2 [uncultured Adlercreutzia sp.]|uniref:SURF2 Surfeit locus protein 2 n=1 Tax=uncultured Adlercreutzia sp. TaxID=875803 RepID=UPI0025F9737C|nr:SURF2 Surfeit locus protein 2 [uncultured Adlercreutzia sp.]MCI9261239.1 SURF2 Surfeit locus protein 2 [Eggerthellaceae bacterium]